MTGGEISRLPNESWLTGSSSPQVSTNASGPVATAFSGNVSSPRSRIESITTSIRAPGAVSVAFSNSSCTHTSKP